RQNADENLQVYLYTREIVPFESASIKPQETPVDRSIKRSA
ncbi:hypothetical protein F441_07675, partial [Phytophthora nicotianae CJ01A1]